MAERVLVLAPTGRDAPLIVQMLARSGVRAESSPDAADVCQKWEEGIGAAIIAEEALWPESLDALLGALRLQPPWSDLPLILLTGGGKTTRYSARVAQGLESFGNVTLLERPLRIITLISAIQSALRPPPAI